jgi:hypothetical protein
MGAATSPRVHPEKEVAVHLNGQTATSFFTRSGEVAAAVRVIAAATSSRVYPEKEVAVHQNGQTAMRKEVADSNLYECQPPLFQASPLFLH